MRPPRVAAGLLAALAVGCYLMLLFAGPRIRWVADVAGQPGAPPEPFHLLGELPWMTVLLAGALLAALLAARRPRPPIPWLLAVGALGDLGFPAIVAGVAAASAGGDAPGWAPYLAWVGNWIWVLGQAGLFYLLLLFPDGRHLSARWRAVARIAAVYIAGAVMLMMLWPELWAAPGLASPISIAGWLGGAEDVLMQVAFVYVLGFLLLQVLMVVCLVLRFVRSVGAERQQYSSVKPECPFRIWAARIIAGCGMHHWGLMSWALEEPPASRLRHWPPSPQGSAPHKRRCQPLFVCAYAPKVRALLPVMRAASRSVAFHKHRSQTERVV
jgi:hypothetical protein